MPLPSQYRTFLETHAHPLEREFLSKPFRDLVPQLAKLREQAKREHLWAPHLPKSHGGLGLSLPEFAEISAVLGESPIGHYLFNCNAPDIGNQELLLTHGSAEQKAKWFEPLARGEIRSCFAMTEPEFAGSNPVWMDTRAVREGGEYVITGHKWFTSSADGAAFTIVMAVTDPDAPPHKRASQIIVPMDAPGVVFVRNIPVMGEQGSDYASHAELRFEGVRVPVTNRIGDEGAGFALAQERLGPGRIHHCMRWLGISERAFRMMVQRAATREIAPGEVLGQQQAVQHWIAECRAEIDAAKLLVLDVASRIERDGAHAARDGISLIKFHVAGVLQRVLDRAIQVHGALGMTDDTPLAYWYRHERGARIYDGPDEVHKSAVAKRILGAAGMKRHG
ncbi:acyl-CoA dehydrogenase family protein [Pseudogemmatithrix spongiicola]|uniref:Acyl-CoA dehydrogenase family protein n=1 Tax=Pseudogemmatithrix spongiicola TaxID=3062599 RepID=A0AA49JS29_9BACT|nr:acyl-CoA dehydrogenase family protein [Gemmatimonadaceae bacterium 'strain 138']WKW13819.1 acyl-CoA dehydrogenase family protein [Gemmatimonadaceae bacterium 'strain 318']